MTKLSEAFEEMVGVLNARIAVHNAVHTKVWAVLLVFFAVGLYDDGKDRAALAISTGAFMMLQAQDRSS
jgi:hypothetical protein